MELTRRTDYAVRVILDLSAQPNGSCTRSAHIARRQLIPRSFLRKIVQILVDRGFVQTHRGTDGGITLARHPEDITLRDVVEAIEGPIRLNRCLVRPGACPLDRICPVHPVWRRLQELITRELESETFEALRHRVSRPGF